MRRFLLVILLFSILVPTSAFAYDTPQDLLKIEKAPSLDSSLVYKFKLDPKQSQASKSSMLSLWGGSSKYKTVVRLPKEDRLVYLVYLNGITDASAIEAELSGTETFGSQVESLQIKSLGIRQLDIVSSSSSSLDRVSNSLESLRSKGLVK